MKCVLTIVRNGVETRAAAETGARLLDALASAGVYITAPCGGKGKCGKCRVRAEGAVKGATDSNGMRLACESALEGDATVYIYGGAASILARGASAAFAADGNEGLGAAIDVGTTTMCAYLMDMKTGETLATASMLNPQRAHGADVISRLTYAIDSDENARALKDEVLCALSEMTGALLKDARREGCEVLARACVGNTVMMHLLGGYPVKSLAAAPFAPAYTKQHSLELGGANTLLGGCVSGYVGADTVAALLACDLDERIENAVFIDIGTNGEIAAMKGGRIVCCSCAAGPAFEGAHIACGTGALKGAIDHAREEGGELRFTTISGAPAIGICGSGLIDLVAVLLDMGVITPMGRMQSDVCLTRDVYLAREDVREVQLAKAAIAAGIQVLLSELDMPLSTVDALYLAGGFGNYVDVRSACAIGMLPMELKNRVKSVGNAAGEGAKRLLLSGRMRARAEALRERMQYIELAAHPDFADLYAENLPLGETE